VLALTDTRNVSSPGYGLIEFYLDPQDRRRKPVRLTKQGRKLVKVIEEELK